MDCSHSFIVSCIYMLNKVEYFCSGSVVGQYGSGEAGSCDGRERDAQFHTPQGLVFHEEALFVADTDNHLLRKVRY